MSADTKSTTRHAICPVKDYDPAKWLGWEIRSTERVYGGWLVHHLVKRGVR